MYDHAWPKFKAVENFHCNNPHTPKSANPRPEEGPDWAET